MASMVTVTKVDALTMIRKEAEHLRSKARYATTKREEREAFQAQITLTIAVQAILDERETKDGKSIPISANYEAARRFVFGEDSDYG